MVTDYKSAWPTDESELSTYQMRAQAVAVYLVMGAIWMVSGCSDQSAHRQDVSA